jgi:outer membrane protein
MRREILVVLVLILLPSALLAQAPATQPQSTAPAPAAAPRQAPAPATPPAAAATAPGGSKVAVVDFQRAITENQEGKKAQDEFLKEISKRQGDFDKKQKSLDEMQNKLKTQTTVLSDTAKADLGRQIDQTTTDLNRMNEDAQKELGEIQQRLFRPIAERTSKVLNAYAQETGFAVVFDVSSQANNIIYVQDVADITTEIIRRVDAEAGKTAAKPAEPAKK